MWMNNAGHEPYSISPRHCRRLRMVATPTPPQPMMPACPGLLLGSRRLGVVEIMRCAMKYPP
jgi:hypothetical protein